MRKLTAGVAGAALVGAVFAVAGMLAWGGVRHSRLATAAARLQQQWKRDEQQGVTASALSPVSDALAAVVGRESSWWLHPWSVAGEAGHRVAQPLQLPQDRAGHALGGVQVAAQHLLLQPVGAVAGD